MNSFTIGYLSWKQHELFKRTLHSHKTNGLYSLIPKENRLIFFQEISNIEKNIATEYDCNYIGDVKNIGILNSFIRLVENCKTDYFIFCENDFILLDNYENYSLELCFQDIKEILDENYYAQVKLSNPCNPGFLYSTPKNKEEWLSRKHDDFPYKIESFSWVDVPEKFYDNIEVIQKRNKWYKVNSEDQRWSNHIYACNTNFLKEVVLPLLKFNRETNNKLDLRYQGLEDTLSFPETMLGKNSDINILISKMKERVVFSGGGNFYHNKVNG
jgi:hypothetical protein